MPRYDDDRLASSSLILADEMERVPSKEIGAGNFVIGRYAYSFRGCRAASCGCR